MKLSRITHKINAAGDTISEKNVFDYTVINYGTASVFVGRPQVEVSANSQVNLGNGNYPQDINDPISFSDTGTKQATVIMLVAESNDPDNSGMASFQTCKP